MVEDEEVEGGGLREVDQEAVIEEADLEEEEVEDEWIPLPNSDSLRLLKLILIAKPPSTPSISQRRP